MDGGSTDRSVEIIRFGSRIPIFLPQRVTDQMVATIRKYHPIWVNIHINHPKELTPEVREACAKLADAGVPLGAQTVLMAGINHRLVTPKGVRQVEHITIRNCLVILPWSICTVQAVEVAERPWRVRVAMVETEAVLFVYIVKI